MAPSSEENPDEPDEPLDETMGDDDTLYMYSYTPLIYIPYRCQGLFLTNITLDLILRVANCGICTVSIYELLY
jgi:hypothetical protein